MRTNSDLAAIDEVCNGNTSAFEAVMRRYNPRLYRAARAILGDGAEAEEVVQETYLRAIDRLGAYRGDAPLATWLLRMAMNIALGRRQRRARLQLGGAAAAPPQAASPEQLAYDDEPRRALEEAVDSLPVKLRLVLVLRLIDGLSTHETAEVLGIPVLTVRVRLARARSALRRALAGKSASEPFDLFVFMREQCDRIVAAVLGRTRQPV